MYFPSFTFFSITSPKQVMNTMDGGKHKNVLFLLPPDVGQDKIKYNEVYFFWDLQQEELCF